MNRLVPLDDEGREFLLAEYRGRVGFDEDLPTDGVLYYKMDLSASLYPDLRSDDPYRLTLLERDGDRGLIRTAVEGGNRGTTGDAWGAGRVTDKLNFHTTPGLAMSAGTYAPVMVHEVSVGRWTGPHRTLHVGGATLDRAGRALRGHEDP